MTRILFSYFLVFLSLSTVFGQNNDAVTYEELYDDPETINKLFVGFQPIIGELWATNPNIGFGVDATYFLKNIAQIRVNARKAYGDRFDMARYGALVNSDMDNEPEVFNYYEIGGTYHFKDFTADSETKLVLYKKSYRGARWAARVPLQATVPSKIRKIYGARGGAMYLDTSVDLNRIIQRQGLTFDDITSIEGGTPLLTEYTTEEGLFKEVKAYSSYQSIGIYAGASMSWIRNVAVDFDEYEPGVDDGILTAYFDILILPYMDMENVFFQGVEYSVEPVLKNIAGFRLGLDGKFNRSLSWGYGGEIGYRPGLKKGGFSALLKITLPMYGTNLDNSVEAFGK